MVPWRRRCCWEGWGRVSSLWASQGDSVSDGVGEGLISIAVLHRAL